MLQPARTPWRLQEPGARTEDLADLTTAARSPCNKKLGGVVVAVSHCSALSRRDRAARARGQTNLNFPSSDYAADAGGEAEEDPCFEDELGLPSGSWVKRLRRGPKLEGPAPQAPAAASAGEEEGAHGGGDDGG